MLNCKKRKAKLGGQVNFCKQMVQRRKYTPKWIPLPPDRDIPKCIWVSKPPVWSKLLLLYIPSHTTKAGADSTPSQSPTIVYIKFKWRILPFCDPGSSSLLKAHAARNPQASWKAELHNWTAKVLLHRGTPARGRQLFALASTEFLTSCSLKSVAYSNCVRVKTGEKLGFFTGGKLWKPCKGFVSPKPRGADTRCSLQEWVVSVQNSSWCAQDTLQRACSRKCSTHIATAGTTKGCSC